jgi:hypothetical protein
MVYITDSKAKPLRVILGSKRRTNEHLPEVMLWWQSQGRPEHVRPRRRSEDLQSV